MKLTLLSSTLLVSLLVSTSAHALGDFGFRAGAGLGLTLTSTEVPDEVAESGPAVPWAIGPAWHVDLSVVGFEANLLYRQGTNVVWNGPSRQLEVSHQQLSLPMLLKFGIPMVPFFEAGVGVEPRLLLGADDASGAADVLETWVWYAPITLGGSFDVGGFELGAELRLEMQLSNHYLGPQADDAREHNLMLFVGGFF